MSRTLAIGDIHGSLAALKRMIEVVPIRDDDFLITLGDYVDRGPDSKGVLDWLIERHRGSRMVSLRGNHDVMFAAAPYNSQERDIWISVGGVQTLMSYGQDGVIATLDDVPYEHFNFIDDDCVKYYETEQHIFVHATVDPKKPLSEQSDETLYWSKLKDLGPHCSGKTVICGHTAQKNGRPLDLRHTICIDTWVYGGGWLTCLDIDTGEYWQTRQSGDFRYRHLAE